MTNVKEFNRLVNKEGKALSEGSLVDFHRKVSLDVLSAVVLKTPEDTGRAMGNWQLSIGSPAKGEVAVRGSASIAAGASAIRSLPPFAVVWLTNNVPYIVALEHGHSRRTPQGMLGVTVAEFEAALR